MPRRIVHLRSRGVVPSRADDVFSAYETCDNFLYECDHLPFTEGSWLLYSTVVYGWAYHP